MKSGRTIEDELKERCEEAYNKGLNDAWELESRMEYMLPEKRSEIFGHCFVDTILKTLTPQEALAKLETYEKEQAEIKVGDVVIVSNREFLITSVFNNHVNLIDSEGNTCCSTKLPCKKTGKHIDIKSLLGQIRSE